MPVVDPRIAGKPVPRVSKETMERECVAREKKARALDVAFLDQRIPRYEREIINMVGMGVTENAALKPNVMEGAVGFSVSTDWHLSRLQEPQRCTRRTTDGDSRRSRSGQSGLASFGIGGGKENGPERRRRREFDYPEACRMSPLRP